MAPFFSLEPVIGLNDTVFAVTSFREDAQAWNGDQRSDAVT